MRLRKLLRRWLGLQSISLLSRELSKDDKQLLEDFVVSEECAAVIKDLFNRAADLQADVNDPKASDEERRLSLARMIEIDSIIQGWHNLRSDIQDG